jgi:hypothetical protein
LLVLLLFFFCCALASGAASHVDFSFFAVLRNRTTNDASVELITTPGFQRTSVVANLPFEGLSSGGSAGISFTADKANGFLFVTNGTSLFSYNRVTGDVIRMALLPSDGTLRHIAFDYKHAAVGAPGHTLYGVWESQDFTVSTVMINSTTLELTTITTANTTGRVRVSYLGLPKPQFGEPEGKHYGIVMEPAGRNPAPGDVIMFVNLRGGDHHWGYVQQGKSSLTNGGSVLHLFQVASVTTVNPHIPYRKTL